MLKKNEKNIYAMKTNSRADNTSKSFVNSIKSSGTEKLCA